jgi:hypothetical protein
MTGEVICMHCIVAADTEAWGGAVAPSGITAENTIRRSAVLSVTGE